jgi:MraZ protein
LRKYAHLEKKVVLIGQGNKFELWDEHLWEQHCLEEDVEDEIPPALAELSL